MQQHNMGAEIRGTGLAELMRYQDETKKWIRHFDDSQPSTVQVVHDRTNQSFMLVVSRLQDQRHIIVMQQQISHNLKYKTDNNDQFHQWRGAQRVVFGLSFPNEQHAMDVHRAVREAQSFLTDLMNSEHINGTAVYQEPQNHYYSHQAATTARQQHHQQSVQQEQNYRDGDGDSLGSNGYNRKYSYAVHPQLVGQPISQQNNLQQQQILQQQRRASQGSSGSSSTVSGNIYATAHLNGYNGNGNAVSATANGSQMPITQVQQLPNRINNVHLNGHHQQVPLRTPVPPSSNIPPCPAPSTNMHQPAPVSNTAPPAPPPPPPPATMNSSAPAKTSGNIPLAPPPPPPNLCKATSGDKPLTMADQIKKQQLRKTDTNGAPETNGSANGNNNRPKPAGPTMDLMSELNNKLRKRNNQDEIGSVTSAASTSSTLSTNSNESSEKREPPPPPKAWTKPSNNTNSSTITLNGTLNGNHQNGHTNGHANGHIDSPKVLKKQFSIPNAASTEDPNTIMCTKADLDRLREEFFAGMQTFKQEILEAIASKK